MFQIESLRGFSFSLKSASRKKNRLLEVLIVYLNEVPKNQDENRFVLPLVEIPPLREDKEQRMFQMNRGGRKR